MLQICFLITFKFYLLFLPFNSIKINLLGKGKVLFYFYLFYFIPFKSLYVIYLLTCQLIVYMPFNCLHASNCLHAIPTIDCISFQARGGKIPSFRPRPLLGWQRKAG